MYKIDKIFLTASAIVASVSFFVILLFVFLVKHILDPSIIVSSPSFFICNHGNSIRWTNDGSLPTENNGAVLGAKTVTSDRKDYPACMFYMGNVSNLKFSDTSHLEFKPASLTPPSISDPYRDFRDSHKGKYKNHSLWEIDANMNLVKFGGYGTVINGITYELSESRFREIFPIKKDREGHPTSEDISRYGSITSVNGKKVAQDCAEEDPKTGNIKDEEGSCLELRK